MRAHCHGLEREREREREEDQSRKSGRRDLLKWTSFACFFAALQDAYVGLLEMSCFSSMVSSISAWYVKRTLLDHQISHLLCEVPCLFFGGLFVFPRSRIDFQKKLDRKHNKQTSCPKTVVCVCLSVRNLSAACVSCRGTPRLTAVWRAGWPVAVDTRSPACGSSTKRGRSLGSQVSSSHRPQAYPKIRSHECPEA